VKIDEMRSHRIFGPDPAGDKPASHSGIPQRVINNLGRISTAKAASGGTSAPACERCRTTSATEIPSTPRTPHELLGISSSVRGPLAVVQGDSTSCAARLERL